MTRTSSRMGPSLACHHTFNNHSPVWLHLQTLHTLLLSQCRPHILQHRQTSSTPLPLRPCPSRPTPHNSSNRDSISCPHPPIQVTIRLPHPLPSPKHQPVSMYPHRAHHQEDTTQLNTRGQGLRTARGAWGRTTATRPLHINNPLPHPPQMAIS